MHVAFFKWNKISANLWSILLYLFPSWLVFDLLLNWDVKTYQMEIYSIETSWWRTTEISLCVSFETYLRRLENVLMGVAVTSSGDVVETHHWDFLATFHQDAIGCFVWDVPATSLDRTDAVTTSPLVLVAGWVSTNYVNSSELLLT